MEKVEHAVDLFTAGNSCSQSVLKAYAEEMGLESGLALKLASGFGGGMARQGQTCGAVTGAMMVIGLKHGFTAPDDDINKDATYKLVREFTRRMEKRFNTTTCNEMVGHDISTAAGHEAAKKDDVFNRLCPGFVRAATEILEDLL